MERGPDAIDVNRANGSLSVMYYIILNEVVHPALLARAIKN